MPGFKKSSGFKMKAGKEGPMKKNFPSAFKADDKKEPTQIAFTDMKPGYVKYKGKFYKSKMGKGFVPGGGTKPVSKMEAMNYEKVS